MNHNAPLPLAHLTGSRPRVLTLAQLREHGVTASDAAERPWQQILPGVFLLHSGPATSEERLHAALLYAGRRGGEAMITGLAALALYRFASAPALLALPQIDVLVPGTRRLRSAGGVRIVRSHTPPRSQEVTGLPVAPVARAVADAVGQLSDAGTVRRLLSEAVRGGHCEPAAVVRELTVARLLNRPHVVDAVESLLAEGRAMAEDRLYHLVRGYELPEPVWNVDLRLPGGPHLGGVDAYWPEQAVAVEIDTRAPRQGEDEQWSESVRKRETLERLGVTVIHITPRKLRDWPEQQAAVVRTALTASGDREPAAYLVVLPR
ncbi:hypothetical protein ACWGF3_05715 [Streptomyces xanthophaeus]|uniref:DUF559 domain-containing protein n=1 Tax=Streptomyces xanthophaeus TaxID=67385 RepID=A0A919H4M8_9ACTN|nr:hypothetical protein [Streptomyces xanthophaeus]WCD86458.1 hypothetical protein KPP03845_102808 [Streptomyces xanthophaeus]WST22500.1 hypothetical protein OG264_13970 [Streptomyces xanthophaeus]WST62524.1 hypothetical protein OG605_24465 [Streptomyces xanthophaeus]GHI89670.1 hypothetical protein Sxan_70340 [Streptomyces xanthophaeus]